MPLGKILSLVLLSPLLAACGCHRLLAPSAFTSYGVVASSGGRLEQFAVSPEACTRDSFLGPREGLPPNATTSVLTFLWANPSLRSDRPDLYRKFGQQTPLRLAVARNEDGEPWILLHTMRNYHSLRITPQACSSLHLNTHETANLIPGNRPALSGDLTMDCAVEGSHLTANITFRNCAF